MKKKLLEIGELIEGIFKERPNRFTGIVEVNNSLEKVHIHDSGRIKEMLFNGNLVKIRKAENNQNRKTGWDLISAKAPESNENVLLNSGLHRYIAEKIFKDPNISPFGRIGELKAEVKHEDSRLDFFIQKENVGIWVETKGVSLVIDKVALFPDAPSVRAQKHLNSLIKLKNDGYRSAIVLLIFRDCNEFRPKNETDEKFSKLFYKAINNGVEVYTLQLSLEGNSIFYDDKKIVILKEKEV